jgi:hypothetical protein
LKLKDRMLIQFHRATRALHDGSHAAQHFTRPSSPLLLPPSLSPIPFRSSLPPGTARAPLRSGISPTGSSECDNPDMYLCGSNEEGGKGGRLHLLATPPPPQLRTRFRLVLSYTSVPLTRLLASCKQRQAPGPVRHFFKDGGRPDLQAVLHESQRARLDHLLPRKEAPGGRGGRREILLRVHGGGRAEREDHVRREWGVAVKKPSLFLAYCAAATLGPAAAVAPTAAPLSRPSPSSLTLPFYSSFATSFTISFSC